jgi:methionyl-tRNA formyltransferase
MSGLSIVFAGTPQFGLPCLNALLQSRHRLKAIYTQPDRPSGRGRKLQASAVKEWALQHHLTVYQPLNFKSLESIAELQALKPDVMVVIAYGLILPRSVLDIPRLGCINVHASLLPRWRGASPIQHAILSGDEKSGVTLMQMDVGMDTGDMLYKVEYPLKLGETAGSLHDELAQLSVKPLLTILDAIETNTVKPEVQKNDLATYAGKINKEDAHIDWHRPALDIDRSIRAYNPWPIAYTLVGTEILRIHKASVIQLESSEVPGSIINIDKRGILVATGFEGLLIETIQFPGAKAMSVKDWLNSGKTVLQVGLILQ